MTGQVYPDAATFNRALEMHLNVTPDQRDILLEAAAVGETKVTPDTIDGNQAR